MNIRKAYRSCYIVDVQIADDEIRLQDSSHCSYYIKTSSKDTMSSFKSWLKNVFLKGVAQTLSVFEYEVAQEDGEAKIYIVKFAGQAFESKQLLTEKV